jgi:glutamate/tyrosine decarboxylase-like PLP-dependent enzyme
VNAVDGGPRLYHGEGMTRADEDLDDFAAAAARRYVEGLGDRAVAPGPDALARLGELDAPFPEEPCDAMQGLRLLEEVAGPATMASAGGRFFGFVIGSTLPASRAAATLASAWDQNGGLVACAPAAAALERIAGRWLLDVLGLPPASGVGFVSGATAGNLVALATARHALAARAGWDVGEDGLFGAPPLSVVVGDEVHVSVLKALSVLGLGRARVTRVPVDDQGRLRADALPPLDDRTILCLQVGNVNTGASDPLAAVIPRARDAGAWVHVDGAFGLWLAAAPERAHLVAGVADADSWATDGHKWLNVPYDSGFAICRDRATMVAAMASGSASYLQLADEQDPYQFTPEMSRRSRGAEVWAALRSLGRSGVAELVERCCRLAARFAAALEAAGHEVRNEVVANQVLVSFGDDDTTHQVVADVQADGTCWCGPTVWQGRASMRISVSSWATTEDDVDRSLAAILRIAAGRMKPARVG